MQYLMAPLLAALLLSGCAQGKDGPQTFLRPNQYDAARLLPPPPPDGSAAQKSELAELEHIQAARTPAMLEAARDDGRNENGGIFDAVLGPAYDLEKLPATNAMIEQILVTEDTASKSAKRYFNRVRPWTEDAGLQTCTSKVGKPTDNSYPSGHATVAYAMAVVMASLVPEKAQAILGRASQFAENRLVCGVHYRSDIVAGEAYGSVLAQELMANPGFRVEYDAAHTELKAAHIAQ